MSNQTRFDYGNIHIKGVQDFFFVSKRVLNVLEMYFHDKMKYVLLTKYMFKLWIIIAIIF